MDNYVRALQYARELFLKWNQEEIIARCKLKHDDAFIRLRFLGDEWQIERRSAVAARITAEGIAEGNFSEGLSIYDYLCRKGTLPLPRTRLCPVNSLPHVAQSNPNTSSLHQKHADYFQQHLPALEHAIAEIALAPFDKGDIACWFEVFDGFNAVFQFWKGDEEFPPSVRFLWPENAQDFLKYETLYYVMGCFLEKLKRRIEEIEKNVK